MAEENNSDSAKGGSSRKVLRGAAILGQRAKRTDDESVNPLGLDEEQLSKIELLQKGETPQPTVSGEDASNQLAEELEAIDAEVNEVDEPVAASDAEPADLQDDEDDVNSDQSDFERARIEEQAKRLGVTAVLTIQDVPRHVSLTKHPQLEQFNDIDTGTIAIFEDGTVLVTDILNPRMNVIRRMLQAHDLKLKLYPATQRVIRSVYSQQAALIDEIEENAEEDDANVVIDSDISRFLEDVVADALAARATDIHVEARDANCDLKFRIDGRLTLYDTVSSRRAMSLGYLLYNALARRGAKEFVTHKALDAACVVKVNGLEVAMRLATAPEARGFDIMIRLLAGAQQELNLDVLGYDPIHLELMRQAVTLPYGVMLMSGPVGSGKSTSLFSLVQEIGTTRKIVSLEDPVEQTLGNVTHVPILEHIEGARWEDMLKGLNRWDSNIVVAGEVRDATTCFALQKMCTSGRLAMSTIHASNCIAIPTRMEDLGADHSMLYDPNFLCLLVNQRLVPKMCEDCKIPLTDIQLDLVLEDSMRRVFPVFDHLFTRSPEGCKNCYEGLKGRALLAEAIKVDSIGRTFIRDRDQQGWQQQLLSTGWRTMSDHAVRKVHMGVLDPLVVKDMVPILDDSASNRAYNYAETEELLAKDGRPIVGLDAIRLE